MKTKRFAILSGIIFSVLVLAALPFMSACTKSAPAPAPAPETKKLQIGVLACLSGFLSGSDTSDLNVDQVTVDVINERGGITVNGQKYLIELLPEDCKSTMDGVTAAANRLVFDKQVKFIIGPPAFFSAAAGPVTDPNKVMRVITYSCNSPGEMDATTPYGFLGSNGSVGQFLGAVKYLKQAYPNVKKVVFVAPDDGSPPYIVPIDKKLLEANGLTVVGDTILYPNEMVDFSPIAAKINAVKDADAVIQLNGIEMQTGNIVKGLRDLGNTKPYAACIPGSLNNVLAVTGKEAGKDVFTTSLSPDEPNLPPLTKEILKRVVAKYGAEYSLLMWGPNCLWSLKNVIEAAQSLDPTVVKNKWESMDKVETVYGTGIICGDVTYGIRHHVVVYPQPISILKDGKVTSGGLIDIGVMP